MGSFIHKIIAPGFRLYGEAGLGRPSGKLQKSSLRNIRVTNWEHDYNVHFKVHDPRAQFLEWGLVSRMLKMHNMTEHLTFNSDTNKVILFQDYIGQ